MKRTLDKSEFRNVGGKSSRMRLFDIFPLIVLLGAMVFSASGSPNIRYDGPTQVFTDESDASQTGFGYDKNRSESPRPAARALRARSVLKGKIARQNDRVLVHTESIVRDDRRSYSDRHPQPSGYLFKTPKNTSSDRMNYFAHRGPPAA